MGRLFAGACCVIVGLQVLVGVPLAVCIAFLSSVHGGAIGSIEIHVRSGKAAAKAGEGAVGDVRPIASSQPPETAASGEVAAIMASRGERGSLLRGTSLAGSLSEENEVFVGTIQQLSSQQFAATPVVLETAPIEEPMCGIDIGSACASEWRRLAAEQEWLGNLGAASRYLELARQCAAGGPESVNPAILTPGAN